MVPDHARVAGVAAGRNGQELGQGRGLAVEPAQRGPFPAVVEAYRGDGAAIREAQHGGTPDARAEVFPGPPLVGWGGEPQAAVEAVTAHQAYAGVVAQKQQIGLIGLDPAELWQSVGAKVDPVGAGIELSRAFVGLVAPEVVGDAPMPHRAPQPVPARPDLVMIPPREAILRDPHHRLAHRPEGRRVQQQPAVGSHRKFGVAEVLEGSGAGDRRGRSPGHAVQGREYAQLSVRRQVRRRFAERAEPAPVEPNEVGERVVYRPIPDAARLEILDHAGLAVLTPAPPGAGRSRRRRVRSLGRGRWAG